MHIIALNRVIKWLFLLIVINICLGIMWSDSTEQFSVFILYLMLYVNIVFIGLFFKTSRQSIDILEPYFVVIFLYTLYSWISALSEVSSEGVFISIMPIYYICLIVGIVGFMLGYRCNYTSSNIIRKITSFKLAISYPRFFKILLLLTIIFSLINYKYLMGIFNISNISSYAEALSSRAEYSDISGPILYLQQLSITLILMSLLFKSFVNRKLSVIAFIFFGIYAIIGVMGGGKSLVISFVTVFIIYYNYYVKRLRIFPVAIITALLLVFATMINHVRSTTNLLTMFNLAIDYATANPVLLLPISSGELVGPPRTLMDVANAIQTGSMNFSFGYTWLTDILIFIPRFIYPNRPLPTPELYVQLLRPMAPKGFGAGGFMPLDGYWAFGYIGVFVIMFIYGSLLAFVYRIVKTNIDNGAVLLIYAFGFFHLITIAIRTGFFGTVKGSIMFVLPFLIILFLSKKKNILEHGEM